jgi:hypothetical protein
MLRDIPEPTWLVYKGNWQKPYFPFLSRRTSGASVLHPFLFFSSSRFRRNASFFRPPPLFHEAFPRISEVALYCMLFPSPFPFNHLSSSAFSRVAAYFACSALWKLSQVVRNLSLVSRTIIGLLRVNPMIPLAQRWMRL